MDTGEGNNNNKKPETKIYNLTKMKIQNLQQKIRGQ